ncbi:hypothetical protein L210DRAFT_851318, partial [Boletus edulis BED1]
ACQTTMGDEVLIDEAMYIAAGMLFAGYKGIVGTIWSISDRMWRGTCTSTCFRVVRDRIIERRQGRCTKRLDVFGRVAFNPFDEWIRTVHPRGSLNLWVFTDSSIMNMSCTVCFAMYKTRMDLIHLLDHVFIDFSDLPYFAQVQHVRV